MLTATSVGITARVFKDLNFLGTKEAKIVLGAAVIDDILGLIILAVVSGIAVTGVIDFISIGSISLKAIIFILLSVLAGLFLAKKSIKLIANKWNVPGMMLSLALLICFMGAYLANQFGLATIVGAFSMGLILDDVHFKNFNSSKTLEEYIQPLSMFLVPIFFVITGLNVDVSVLQDPAVIYSSIALCLVAILSKLACGWAFPSKEKFSRILIGVGMIPRGEVGLIFASVGKSIGVVDDRLYAVAVIVVITTTLVTPPILAFLIDKLSKTGTNEQS
jgi:Kef-type K+ transport system membrane component KefB